MCCYFQSVAIANKVMSSERAAVIIMDEQDPKGIVIDLLRRGWAVRNTKPPQELLEACTPHNIAVIDAYGEFDDHDVSVAAIGRKDLVIDLNT